MKKLLVLTMMAGFAAFGTVKAQSTENMADLKVKKEILKLNTKLNNDKIKLEKERKDFAQYKDAVESANRTADRKGSNFSGSNDLKDTEKEAKKAAKSMKDVQRANDRLAKSQKNIENLEKDIKKSEEKISKLKQQIEFVDKK